MTATQFMLSGLLGASAALALAREPPASELREMAIRYEHARGVKQDYAEAYRLYCRAAVLGDAHSAYSIGWMYFDTHGFPLRADLALGWFQKAAAAGDGYAARLLKRFRGIKPQDDPACPLPVKRRPPINNPNRKIVEAWVNRIAPRYAIDPQLILAVIQEESDFNPSALSPKNAQGLMQLIPATAQRFGVKDVWNPLENIRGGTAYLHWLMRHFTGNVEWVLAAYNAGEKTVEQYQGVPPFDETRNYVRHILAAYPKTAHPVPPALRGEKLF